MGCFQDLIVTWDGRDYPVKSHKIMGLLSRIEEIITFTELQQYSARGTVPLVKLAMTYGVVLRYAGCRVSDEDVYASLFGDSGDQNMVVMPVTKIMALMLPPSERTRFFEALDGEGEGEGEGESVGKSAPATRDTSKKHTKSRSEKTAS